MRILIRMFSTVGDVQYFKVIPFSTLRDTISTVGDIQYQICRGYSILWGYHQYCGACSVQWSMFSTVEHVQYCGGCSVLWRMFSTVDDVVL